MKRQEQETVSRVESKQYRRAMANLPNDNKESLCGICGDVPVILNSAYKCATCAAPVCQKCFDRVMRFEKIKWKWTHASTAKNLCFHPRHPDCFTRASMKIIRDTTTRDIQCEVCEHRQMKKDEDADNFWTGPYGVLVPTEIRSVVAEDGLNSVDIDGFETEMYTSKPLTKDEWLAKFSTVDENGRVVYRERPSTQPSSPLRTNTTFICGSCMPPQPLGDLTVNLTEEDEDDDQETDGKGGMSASSNGADHDSASCNCLHCREWDKLDA